jgi:hypothetical protein
MDRLCDTALAGSREGVHGWLVAETIFAVALWLMVAVVMTRFLHQERAASVLPRTIEVRGPA